MFKCVTNTNMPSPELLEHRVDYEASAYPVVGELAVSDVLETSDEEPLNPAEQAIVDQFAPIREKVNDWAARSHDPDDDPAYYMTRDLSLDLINLTDRILPSTRAYEGPGKGVVPDSRLTKRFFTELKGVQDKLAEVGDSTLVSQQLIHVHVAVLNEFTAMLNENGGRVREMTHQEQPEQVETLASYLDYFNRQANNHFARVALSKLGVTGSEGVLGAPAFDRFHDTQAWQFQFVAPRLGQGLAAEKDGGAGGLSSLLELEDVEEQFKQGVKAYGFDEREARSILRAIESFDPDETESQTKALQITNKIMVWINNVGMLARENPKLPTEVYRRFGIRNFDRYNPHKLISQSKADFEPTGIAVSATSDYNGALSSFLTDAERVTYLPLMVEVESPHDFARRIILLKHAGIRVNNVFIGAHGAPDQMKLGNRYKERLFSEKITSLDARRLMEDGIIEPDTKVTLLSCNTGVAGGIGEQIAGLPNVGGVRAPNFVSYGLHRNWDTLELEFGTGPKSIDPETGLPFENQVSSPGAVFSASGTKRR